MVSLCLNYKKITHPESNYPNERQMCSGCCGRCQQRSNGAWLLSSLHMRKSSKRRNLAHREAAGARLARVAAASVTPGPLRTVNGGYHTLALSDAYAIIPIVSWHAVQSLAWR